MTTAKTSLISPLIDFAMVGGLSFFFILPVILMDITAPVAITAIVALAYIINDPHFIHSYQLMYDNFLAKLRNRDTSLSIRLRFIFAGVIVPILFVAWFAFCMATQNIELLAYSGNLMILAVGWHYAKQGYGILIVLSLLKKIYYTPWQKRALLINAYVVWMTTWLLLNSRLGTITIADVTIKGITVPPYVLSLALSVTIFTTLAAIGALAQSFHTTKRLAVNGVIGYFSAYLWMFLRSTNIVLYALIPVFHSLQYLPFVWTYKLNQSRHTAGTQNFPKSIKEVILAPTFSIFRRFIITGLVISVSVFHLIPWVLDKTIPYNQEVFGTQVFLFMIVILINVHHYLIDNVIWRGENKDVRMYLFNTPPK